METIKFSVLMSVYKKEKPDYLAACLESLVNQTLLPAEMLILCDGPLTDELEAVLHTYKEKFPDLVNIVPFSENRGLGYTLADGVELAKYDLIARMDTDDIAVSDRFAKQVDYMSQHPDIDILGSNIFEFSDSVEHVTASRIVPETHDDIYRFAKRRNPFNHMTVMYRREAVLAAGNYQPLKGYEDYYLWVRMLANGAQAANLADKLVYARADEEMYKRRGGWSYFKSGMAAYNKIYQVGLANPVDYIVRVTGQFIFNLTPIKLRTFLYKKVLRKDDEVRTGEG